MKAGRKGVMPKKRDRIEDGLAYWRAALSEFRAESRFIDNRSMFEIFCKMMAMPSPLLCEAAKFFDLDLDNETQRGALLGILASIVFSKPKSGRPRANKSKWDVLTLIQLAVDCNNVKADAPGISDTKAGAEIKKRFPVRYKHDSPLMIRQNLKPAREWLENENRIRADRGLAPITLELARPVLTVE
jgi:hypothetical protein